MLLWEFVFYVFTYETEAFTESPRITFHNTLAYGEGISELSCKMECHLVIVTLPRRGMRGLRFSLCLETKGSRTGHYKKVKSLAPLCLNRACSCDLSCWNEVRWGSKWLRNAVLLSAWGSRSTVPQALWISACYSGVF